MTKTIATEIKLLKEIKLVNEHLSLINEKHTINKRLEQIDDELHMTKRRLNETQYFQLNNDTNTIELLDDKKENEDDTDNEDDDEDEHTHKLQKLFLSSKPEN